MIYCFPGDLYGLWEPEEIPLHLSLSSGTEKALYSSPTPSDTDMHANDGITPPQLICTRNSAFPTYIIYVPKVIIVFDTKI
jgi:hypothetical protein